MSKAPQLSAHDRKYDTPNSVPTTPKSPNLGSPRSCANIRTASDNTQPSGTTPPKVSSRLCIITAIESGTSLSSLRQELGVSESTFQYHLNKLKKQGVIRKVGYGTWEILKPLDQEDPIPRGSSRVGSPQHPPSRGSSRGSPAVVKQSQLTQFRQDAVRGHAFVLTLQVPRGLRNWNNRKRTDFLETREIPFKQLNIGGGGQRIMIKDKKVWLTDKSIVIYDRSSYFADDAMQAKGTAIAAHLSMIRQIERLLHVSFEIGSDYKFRVSRQHYALIYNALAKQYNEDGGKLEIRTGKGLWFLIDNSFNMDEAETVHPSSGMSDNLKVQNFFNSLKVQPITTEFILTAMAGIQANQMAFAENITSHIDAVRKLGDGVENMTDLMRRIAEMTR